MMTTIYSVIVFAGSSPPRPVRSVGPFATSDDAKAWCERNGLGDTPVEDWWAVVMPPELLTTERRDG